MTSKLFIGISQKPEDPRFPSDATPESLVALLGIFPISPIKLAIGQQIHGVHIQTVDPSRVEPLTIFPGTDALATQVPGVALGIFTADCTPAVIFDPVTRTIGTAHAGWRGTYEEILVRLMEHLTTTFQIKPQNCHAVLGPAISGNCYEISWDRAEMFRTALPYSQPYFSMSAHGKPNVDLRGIQRAQLQRAGLPDHQVAIDPACTHCEPERYYSFRRDGKLAGRHLTIAVIL